MRRVAIPIVVLGILTWGCTSDGAQTASEPTLTGWLATMPALECANNSAASGEDVYVDVGTDDPERLTEAATAALTEVGYMLPGETLRVVGDDEPTGLAVQSPAGRTIAVFSLVEDHKFGPDAPGPGPFITEPLLCILTVEPREDRS